MNLRMTKEEYKLLMLLFQEGLISIIIKKTYNGDVSDLFSYDKYANLNLKLLNQGVEQDSEPSSFDVNDLLHQMVDVINKNEINEDDLIDTLDESFLCDSYSFLRRFFLHGILNNKIDFNS